MRMVTCLLLVLTLAFSAANARPAAKPPLFDPARHIGLEEVKAGMKGYGLTVLQDTTIERFEVEVVSILSNNFGPQQDVILVRLKHPFIEHAGAIQGMSGSPVYITDDAGRSRLAGAFAYGWPLSKDAIGGVQPIEYMLRTRQHPRGQENAPIAQRTPDSWNLATAGVIPAFSGGDTLKNWMHRVAPPQKAFAGLLPMNTPLSVVGGDASLVNQLNELFAGTQFKPLAANAARADKTIDAPLQPGSVLAVSVLSGDLELSAVGTCTEIIGDDVFGFGHEFFAQGPIKAPMSAGTINLVVPLITASFKIGTPGPTLGTLDFDGVHGVSGTRGKGPDTIPITVRVDYENAPDNEFHYQAARLPNLLPMIAFSAIQASLSQQRQLPNEHTIHYDIEFKLDGGRSIKLQNTVAEIGATDLGREIVWPMLALISNPFEEVLPTQINVAARVEPRARLATLQRVHADRTFARPGETVNIDVELEHYRGEKWAHRIAFKLPDDLPDGPISIAVGDADGLLGSRLAADPGSFTTFNANDLIRLIGEVGSIQRDRVYARLVREPKALSIEGQTLPTLPASRVARLAGTPRPGISPASALVVESISPGVVVQGEGKVALNIKSK